MKVETPQILWNSEPEKGKNAPLLSVDMIESGLSDVVSSSTSSSASSSSSSTTSSSSKDYSHVLVTAGNATTINLWKVQFNGGKSGSSNDNNNNNNGGNNNADTTANNGSSGTSSSFSSSPSPSIFRKQTRPVNKIDFMMSLCRHDVAVNAVKFSPDGLHLVTAGDSGNIVLWSVPVHKRGNNNGRHYWSEIKKESDLSVRIISTHCEGVVDLSWSADSKRFVVGTIDSCLLIYEDKNHAMNACSPETHQKQSDWQQVYRNGEHGSFVQGVSYDPLGVYVASMGSDRTVRVFPRKSPPKSKKKVLRPSNNGSSNNNSRTSLARTVTPPHDHQRFVSQLLTESKIELGKTKRIKQRTTIVDETTGQQTKQKLFVDESNCESFFRRLSWTADGAFLVTPAALWHPADEEKGDGKGGEDDKSQPTNTSNSTNGPSFSTYVFARHRFDEPYKVLPGLEKPSVVVRPNPVLFKLPGTEKLGPDASKENERPASSSSNDDSNNNSNAVAANTSPCGLPYRSVFAVLTLDSVLIYDTHHSKPLSVIQGLHYAGLTDCCWSQDGMNLMVSSSDGYISIVNFSSGELGHVYTPPKTTTAESASRKSTAESNKTPAASVASSTIAPPTEMAPLPPCEDEGKPTILEGRPAKKKRVSPTFVSVLEGIPSSKPAVTLKANTKEGAKVESNSKTTPAPKRSIAETETEIVPAVTKLSLDGANTNPSAAVAAAVPSSSSSSTSSDVTSGNAKKKQKKRAVLLSVSNP
eukprot:CAMPEP_0113480046 /NCGR_PEP_ID=MMETSP0014_2-20120614/21648_1 /TAXON_ID=2857 /ORGANISM="Nitzschia sp." /LENGTH=752 /DNA_ID=CAMNT_0000373413 /DNA_START=257 /DNA_END=2515 /DNA_ORIENTATION=+ /assembly_acc=CAM_ASM_000159